MSVLGFGIYTAPTLGSKKFSASYGIKLFTWYAIKPEVRKFFGLKSIEDCPTHSVVYGEKTVSGKQLLFEANKTMELNVNELTYSADGPMRKFSYVLNNKDYRDIDLFYNLVKDKGNKIYGIWEWFNFIRRAFWWFVFKRDISGSHQYFAWLDMCSELVARDIMAHPVPKTHKELSKINFNVISPADLLNVIYVGIMAGEIVQEK